MSTVQQTASTAIAPARRSWFRRHKILTGLGVLIALALVAGYIWLWPMAKWRFHRLFVASLEEIQHSPVAIERLGEPISVPFLPFPSGRVDYQGKDRGDANFYFTVVGSRGKADATSLLRMIDGKWGYTQLKLKFDGVPEIDLASAINAREGGGVPKFDPNAKQSDVKPPDLPVDIALPDLPAMPK